MRISEALVVGGSVATGVGGLGALASVSQIHDLHNKLDVAQQLTDNSLAPAQIEELCLHSKAVTVQHAHIITGHFCSDLAHNPPATIDMIRDTLSVYHYTLYGSTAL